jgi:pyruvate dehydrogenase kinase 2/3/4
MKELIKFPPITLNADIRQALMVPRPEEAALPKSTPNPYMTKVTDDLALANGNASLNKLRIRVPMERRYCKVTISRTNPQNVDVSRYYAEAKGIDWPPEIQEYNKEFTKALELIKKRHDPTVTTVAQGVLEWKRKQNARNIALDIQAWLDRFYMSRIGIRFLIGQRKLSIVLCCIPPGPHNTTDIALNTQQAHPDYVGIICTNAVGFLLPFFLLPF